MWIKPTFPSGNWTKAPKLVIPETSPSTIAPTSSERIQMIASEATGFIYVVSSMGVTGMRSEIKTDLESIISDIKEVTNIPVAVGFGINTPEQAQNISKIADGVIVGSAIVNIIAEHGENAKQPIINYVKSMKNAISWFKYCLNYLMQIGIFDYYILILHLF